jgi:hypothetical protein
MQGIEAAEDIRADSSSGDTLPSTAGVRALRRTAAADASSSPTTACVALGAM